MFYIHTKNPFIKTAYKVRFNQSCFLSLNEKKEIIQWYKNYFNEKQDLIKEALLNEEKEAEYKKSLYNAKQNNA